MSKFKDLFPEEEKQNEVSSDTISETRPIDTKPKQPSWFSKNKKTLLYGVSGLAVLLLAYSFWPEKKDLKVASILDQAEEICNNRAEDSSQCKDAMEAVSAELEVDGNEITYDGETLVCDPEKSKEPCPNPRFEEILNFCQKLDCKDEIFIYSLGAPDIAGAPGGGGTREDVRIQSLLFPPAVVAKGLAVEGVQDAYEEEFSIFEPPNGLHATKGQEAKRQEGFIGCCHQEGSGGDCSAQGPKSSYNNCIVSSGYDHLIYCGTIREESKTISAEDWAKVRPEDVALSFMYYRGAALAESTDDIALKDIWVGQALQVSNRTFNWSIFEEVVTEDTRERFVQNLPQYFDKDETDEADIKKAFEKAFDSDGDRKACFVLSNADTAEPTKYTHEDPLAVALAMPTFVSYNSNADASKLSSAPFLLHMQTTAKDRELWKRQLFYGSDSRVAERAQDIASKAFKNPNNSVFELNTPREDLGGPVEFLRDSQSSSPLLFSKNSERTLYKLQFKNSSPFDGFDIHYETLNSDEDVNTKFKSCKKKNQCCLFDVSYSLFGNRKKETEVDPTVIALYGGAGKKACVSPIFHFIMEDKGQGNGIQKNLLNQIEISLGMPNSTATCKQCRGGLLPKYVLDNPRPTSNNFSNSTPVCDSTVVIGYPDGEQQLLESVANTLRDELEKNFKGLATYQVRGMNETDLKDSVFTILISTEKFYTMKDAPSLYTYKLRDLSKGRITPPFQGTSQEDKCARCLFKVADKLLYGGSPSYIPSDEGCDNEGQFLMNTCGVSENHIEEYDLLLPYLEAKYQQSDHPVLHLYYYAPKRIITDVDINGISCKDALETIINKK